MRPTRERIKQYRDISQRVGSICIGPDEVEAWLALDDAARDLIKSYDDDRIVSTRHINVLEAALLEATP